MNTAVHLRFEPRIGPFLRENALGTILLLIAIPIGLRVSARASWWFGISAAVLTSIIAWVVYLRRYRRKAPLWVAVTDEGVEIHQRDGSVARAAWSDVQRATHESAYGLRWRLELATGDEVTVRDDGFDHLDWTRLSTAVSTAVEVAGGEVVIGDGLEQFVEAGPRPGG